VRLVLAALLLGLVGAGSGAAAAPPTTAIPVIKQAYRNNCETAALSMLLRARRVRVDQIQLQRELPRSGPLDPDETPAGMWRWGDPEQGFVGRVEGGGVAGGYGVYTGPIRALARRHKVYLYGLTGRAPAEIYRRLRRGRAVMVWVGLSEGPYRRWLSPSGRVVNGNFGEHTVVLVGVTPTSVIVNDPLSGSRLTWSKASFETMWSRLGRRAVGV
jgi:uncharacterized protein YvpB